MRRRRRERPKPMPTEEEKRKAQIKATVSDPLVWAMKTVDDEFPDERVKSEETIKAEATVTEPPKPPVDDDDDLLDDDDDVIVDEHPTEIKAEGKLTMPMGEGVMTMEVEPMRQNVDGVEKPKNERPRRELPLEDKPVNKKGAKKSDEHKTQVKITALESKQKKMMIGLVALVILAIGGVVFGVAAMVNQKNATEELEDQIAISGYVTDNTVDGEYILLKNWEMKIKLISGLTNVSFDYDEDEYSSVLIWGTRKDNGANYVPDFAKQSKNGNALGTVTRVPRYERAAAGRLIWYDDYYNYYYQGPSGEPEASEEEMSWWVESYLLIKDMLTDADNYIKFEDTAISQQ